MPHEALFYSRLKNDLVQCHLCPKNCVIKPGEYGLCSARKNISGKLYSMVYSNLCSVAIDPIEKKPLYHFMPGEKVFSLGTTGCNLHCNFCQNWEISQTKPNETLKPSLTPQNLIQEVIRSKCKIIAYTYNEPTIFYEYMLESAKLAKQNNLKNVLVSNGFINEKPLKELLPYIDAANIDLKSFDNNFYKNVCSGQLKPVLDTLKSIKKAGVHLEITNLIIPNLNDNMKLIDKMCRWVHKNLGDDVPLHFSAFYPCYRLLDKEPTPIKTLLKAKKIAEKNSLNYVYLGNVSSDSSTYCPKCKKILIEHKIYKTNQKNIINGKCKFCKEKIKGVWS
jgi:pyruvate formate lyase activating enzyme